MYWIFIGFQDEKTLLLIGYQLDFQRNEMKTLQLDLEEGDYPTVIRSSLGKSVSFYLGTRNGCIYSINLRTLAVKLFKKYTSAVTALHSVKKLHVVLSGHADGKIIVWNNFKRYHINRWTSNEEREQYGLRSDGFMLMHEGHR